jgi:hypothetical protein
MQAGGTITIGRLDPFLRDLDLPLERVYYPLGFPLRVATNSEQALAAAAGSWGAYTPEFDVPPVSLRVVMEPGEEEAPEPSYRQQGPLSSIVSDRHNFAVMDFQTIAGFAFAGERTLRDPVWWRWFFLDPLVYSALEQRYIAAMHSACIARDGVGVLLCGPSGAGKSTLAFACARAGWSFVSDEAVHVLLNAEDGSVVGKPHQARFRPDAASRFPELQNYPPVRRPNGKLSIEVPLREIPQIRTALRCRVGSVLVLDRRPGQKARLASISREGAGDALLREKPFYGPELWARHEYAIRGLTQAPVYRLEYDDLDQAVRLLCTLPPNGL